MVTAAPLCGQLPRSARGREACDGVPSATEGARAREHSLPLRAVYSLLVCYRPLDNIIFARRAKERRGREPKYAEVYPRTHAAAVLGKKLGVRPLQQKTALHAAHSGLFVQTSVA